MSDKNDQFDESTLSPEALAHFERKYAPLANKRDELLQANSRLKSEIDALGGFETIKSLKAQADEAARQAEETRKGRLTAEERLRELEDAHRKQISDRDARFERLQNSLKKSSVDATVAEAIRAENGIPELLTPFVAQRVRAEIDDNGKTQITVLGPNGETTDAKGNPYTLKNVVAEMKQHEVYSHAFKVTTPSGGGSRQGSARGGNNPFTKGGSLTEQSRAIQGTPDIARQMARDAGWKDTEITW